MADTEKQVLQEKLKQAQEVRDDYHRTFLKTAHGRRVLNDLLRECKVFEPLTIGNAQQTAADEGSRRVGLTILQALDKNSVDGMRDLYRKHLENAPNLEE